MDFYDVIGPGCAFDDQLQIRLGYKRLFKVGKDVAVLEAGSEGQRSGAYLAAGDNPSRLIYHAKNGAAGIIPTAMAAEAKLLDAMRDNGCVAVIPLDAIIWRGAESRSKMLYRAARLFSQARKADVHVSIVSMARNRAYMESPIQLIGLAKLIGAEEGYARYMVSKVNGSLGGADD